MIRAMIRENLQLGCKEKKGFAGVAAELPRSSGNGNEDMMASRHQIALPVCHEQGKHLADVLNARVSVRKYAEVDVGLGDLGTILRAAKKGDLNDWSKENELGVELNFYVIARNVESLSRGQICRYDSAAHKLELIGCSDPQEEICTLQEEFSCAPAIIAVCGSMARSVAEYGAHGYRQILTRGGAAVQRAATVAISLGYVGCIFAGLYQRPLREVVGIDGYHETQLLAYSFGRP